MSVEELIKDLWKIEILAGKLRENDVMYENIPFEYRQILNRMGKIISKLVSDMIIILRFGKEKDRIKIAKKISKIYSVIETK